MYNNVGRESVRTQCIGKSVHSIQFCCKPNSLGSKKSILDQKYDVIESRKKFFHILFNSEKEEKKERLPCSGMVTFCPAVPVTIAVAIVSRLCPGEIDISAVMLEGAIFNFVPSVMTLSISVSFGGSSPKSLLLALPAAGEL